MGVPENIDALLVKFDITQDNLARIAEVTPGAVTGWRKGSTPRKDAVKHICDYFNLSEDDLLSENYGLAAKEHGFAPPLPKNARPAVGMAMGLAPRLGKVHAGVLAEPEVFDEATMVQIPQFLLDQDPECFVVSSEGDCMDMVFSEGSDLVVSRKKKPKDKSIVLASVDGGEYIVRRLHITTSTWILSPESHNPAHKDIIITMDSEHSLEIPGVVTWYQASREME
ncbi:MAG: helix-turn-helix domain-containing protein [Adlercreutzia sp.]|nr:helix-turn-helix domain-containing protein [Adlercreutzia sp.]